jgi:TetR/AcrR family transcriptional regulator, tetracycline repressor protein
LLREEGLEGLSLRRLAARLDIRAPSLYWHIPDKSALLAAVLERLFTDCLGQVPDHRRWRDWMRDFAAALWNTQESVRDFSLLLISAPMGESQVKRVERLLTARLASLDLPVAECLQIQSSVQVLVTGWFIFAHSHFSSALARRMNFRERALRDLEFLLQGQGRGRSRRRR